jgi:phospholipase/carboxylesterase
MSPLYHDERLATNDAEGLLVLHHGRGSHEGDMLAFADILDPHGRLHVVTPRGPLEVPGPAYQWYVTGQIGYPQAPSFAAAYRQLAEFHDQLWQTTGIGPERTVLGGFSMGTVMSYALALGEDRPAPAGILAFSGYIPTVEVWHPDVSRPSIRAFISHGRHDELIDVEFGREARRRLLEAGNEVDYGESEAGHTIEPAQIRRAVKWLAGLRFDAAA